MIEGEIISLTVTASDSDGTIPHIFIKNTSIPYSFIDNGNGTASVVFRPGCSDHGTYDIGLFATDNIDTVQNSFTLVIDDVNFDPVFDTTGYYIAHELQTFNATINVYDCDGTAPAIKIINAPQGASFIDNNRWNRIFDLDT